MQCGCLQETEAIATFQQVMEVEAQGSLRITAAVNLATCIVHQGQLHKAIEVPLGCKINLSL